MAVSIRSFEVKIALALLSAFPCFGQEARTTTGLDRFVNRDLRKDPLSPIEYKELSPIVGEMSKGYLLEPAPWRIWKTLRHGETRYVVLFGENLVMIPGASTACLLLLDQHFRQADRRCFQTGWRIRQTEALFEFSSIAETEMVIVNVAPVINGRNVAKEYFSISGDTIRLIRIENNRGEALANEYVFSNFEIGFPPDSTSLSEWTRMLESEEPPIVLAALMFLSGRHSTERVWQDVPHESKTVDLARRLNADPVIRKTIETLCQSANPWIREAALLTKDSKDRTVY